MPLTHEQRVAMGLDDPTPPLLGEFDQQPIMPTGGVLMPKREVNVRLLLKPDEKATSPRIRNLVNELLAGNVENANHALSQLFAINPKVALELYIELAQFALPKLKAVAVQISDNSDAPRRLTTEQLQQMLQE